MKPTTIMTTRRTRSATQRALALPTPTPTPTPTTTTKRTHSAILTTPAAPTPKTTTKRTHPETQTTPVPDPNPDPKRTKTSPTQTTPAPAPNTNSVFDTNDGGVFGEYILGLATPSDRQSIHDKNFEAKLKECSVYQAKASAALSELMPEIQSRPPASVLTELEDLKREIAGARSKEKELEATVTTLTHQNEELLRNEMGFKDTISSLTHQNDELLRNEKGFKDTISSLTLKDKMFSTRFASYESQLFALETENKMIKEELMVVDKKYLGAKIEGITEGLIKGKAKWLKSIEFLDHLTKSSMQYFNYGFDSCQKQAEEQGFTGRLDKDSALKNPPKLQGWEAS